MTAAGIGAGEVVATVDYVIRIRADAARIHCRPDAVTVEI